MRARAAAHAERRPRNCRPRRTAWAATAGVDVGLRLDLLAALARLSPEQREPLLLVLRRAVQLCRGGRGDAHPGRHGDVARVPRARAALRPARRPPAGSATVARAPLPSAHPAAVSARRESNDHGPRIDRRRTAQRLGRRRARRRRAARAGRRLAARAPAGRRTRAPVGGRPRRAARAAGARRSTSRCRRAARAGARPQRRHAALGRRPRWRPALLLAGGCIGALLGRQGQRRRERWRVAGRHGAAGCSAPPWRTASTCPSRAMRSRSRRRRSTWRAG